MAGTNLIQRIFKTIKRKNEEDLSEARSLFNSKLHAGIQGGEIERRRVSTIKYLNQFML